MYLFRLDIIFPCDALAPHSDAKAIPRATNYTQEVEADHANILSESSPHPAAEIAKIPKIDSNLAEYTNFGISFRIPFHPSCRALWHVAPFGWMHHGVPRRPGSKNKTTQKSTQKGTFCVHALGARLSAALRPRDTPRCPRYGLWPYARARFVRPYKKSHQTHQMPWIFTASSCRNL